jgi:hypothetical protein
MPTISRWSATRQELHEVRFAAFRAEPSGMLDLNPTVGMGGTVFEREYTNGST